MSCIDGVGRRVVSTQALAVKRPVLELSNVLGAVFILINSLSFHAAGLGPALVGREGVHECYLLPSDTASGLGVLQAAAVVWFCPASRLVSTLVGGWCRRSGATVTKSSSANPTVLSNTMGSSPASVRVPPSTPGDASNGGG